MGDNIIVPPIRKPKMMNSIWNVTIQEWERQLESELTFPEIVAKRRKLNVETERIRNIEKKKKRRSVTVYHITINPNLSTKPVFEKGEQRASYQARLSQYQKAMRDILLNSTKDLNAVIYKSLGKVDENGENRDIRRKNPEKIKTIQAFTRYEQGATYKKDHLHVKVKVTHRTRLQIDYDTFHEEIFKSLKERSAHYADLLGDSNLFKNDILPGKGGEGGMFSHPPNVFIQFVKNGGDAVLDYDEKSSDEEDERDNEKYFY